MEAKKKASIYVGTYAKYNAGKLDGGWLCLDDYETFDQLLAACKKLHSGEKDPEYMVQDYENLPDGISMGESLNRQDFDDIKAAQREEAEAENEAAPAYRIIDYSEKAIAVVGDTKAIKDELKAMGGRFNSRLSCGAGWIFSKKLEEKVRKLLEAGNVSTGKTEAPAKNPDAAMYKAALEEYKANNDDYWAKDAVGAVKVRDKFYLISKPSIENQFCFHDEGPDYEYYKKLMNNEELLRRHFISKNLSVFDKELKKLEECRQAISEDAYSSRRLNRWYIYKPDFYRERSEYIIDLTGEEVETLRKAIQYGRDCMQKRLNAYLKRWGVSKLHTWTYWADR